MYHLCLCHISHSISLLDQFSCKDHIFIKNGLLYKPPPLQIQLPSVHCTHIGTKIRLDTEFRQVCQPFHPAFLRIIKLSRILFHQPAVFPWQLSGIGSSDFFVLFHRLHQFFNQMAVFRQCILGHKQQIICPAHPRRLIPCLSMIEFLSGQMVHFHRNRRFLISCFPVFLSCIHHDQTVYRPGLSFQSAQHLFPSFSRTISRDNHIYRFLFHNLLHFLYM